MAKLWAIIKREYLERVRSKWFLIATFFGPIFFAAIIIVPAWMASKSKATSDVYNTTILDATDTGFGHRLAVNIAGDTTIAGRVPTVMLVPPNELTKAESTVTREVMRKERTGYVVVDQQTLAGESARYAGTNATSIADMTQIKNAIRQTILASRLQKVGLDNEKMKEITFIPLDFTTERITERGRAGSGMASVLFGFAIGFLLTVRHWGASYAQLTGVTAGICFTACVVVWGVFTLQDGVLTGLRSAIWVPIENGLFGIVKIALLVALASGLPHTGMYVSWMLPVALSVPLINILIFARLMPRHKRLTADCAPPTGKQIGRFLAGDYTGALCVLATTVLVPVLVSVRTDPGTYAYFYIAWIIGATLDLFAVNMATSLTVEGAFDVATLAVNCRAALRRAMFILVPIVGAMALLAPWVLGLFGAGYATHGALILELLAVATLPKAVTEIYLGALRAQSRTSLIALIQGVRCVLVLGLALGLTRLVGIAGAGVAVLASQVIVAILVAPGLRRIVAAARWRPVPLLAEGEIR